MFLIDYLISGTIDVLLVNEWENKAVIGDWKTNRSGLRFTAGYYRKDKKQHPAQLTSDWVEKKNFFFRLFNIFLIVMEAFIIFNFLCMAKLLI